MRCTDFSGATGVSPVQHNGGRARTPGALTTQAADLAVGQPWLVHASHSALVLVAGRAWPESDPDQSLNCSQTPPWPLGCASSAGEQPQHRNAIARNWACTQPPPASQEAPPPTARSLSTPAPTRSGPFRN